MHSPAKASRVLCYLLLQDMATFAYIPFAQSYGPLVWCCANCGSWNKTRFAPGQYRVRCRNRECKRWWEHVDGFRPVREHGHALPRPRDTIRALHPMRAALLLPRRLSATECLNVILPEEDDDAPMQTSTEPVTK